MIAFNRSRGNVLGERIAGAITFLSRGRGLLGRPALEEGEGLWIAPCRIVHTFGMSFSIDVIFIDNEGRILGLHPEMPQARITRYYRKAAGALELPSGVIGRTGAAAGDIVELTEVLQR
ncbi:MAG: DUF192 domain-containing protein [Deltaproteobacteria bacterium]|nr:DUF192 domain-containing protein [Deltaproteobacteria bacterium]